MPRLFAKIFGVLLLAIAVWQLAPAQTLASCGDYVVAGGHAGFATKTELAEKSHGQLPAMPQAPCNGLSCRKGPVLPVSVPSALVVESENHRILSSLAVHYGCDERGTFGVFGQCFPLALGVAKEIERPPQLV